MEKKELLNSRPFLPKICLVGYWFIAIISIVLIFFATIILSNDINFEKNGVEIEAIVDEIVETSDTRKVYITYEYDGIIYSHKDLKYWSEEVDIDSKVIIKVLKNDPIKFTGKTTKASLPYIFYGIGLILLIIAIIDFSKYYIERSRIYYLLTKGEKKEGIIESCEQMSEKYVFNTLPWCITALIGDKVFNSKKYYIKFSLTGVVGYLVDIYIDKYNDDNYYIDLVSFRRKEKII